MPEQTLSEARRSRQLRVLRALEDVGCEYVGGLAFDTNLPLSTVRRDLEALEGAGLVEGFKVDERDLLPDGRVRVYWNATEAGRRFLSDAGDKPALNQDGPGKDREDG